MATLAEIRAKLQEQEVKRSPNSSGGDNAIYPFWNIPEGTTATLRFLADKDPENTPIAGSKCGPLTGRPFSTARRAFHTQR